MDHLTKIYREEENNNLFWKNFVGSLFTFFENLRANCEFTFKYYKYGSLYITVFTNNILYK